MYQSSFWSDFALQDHKVPPCRKVHKYFSCPTYRSFFSSFCGLIRPLCSKVMGKKGLKTVLWIRIGFHEDSDPDPTFYIRIRIQGAKCGSMRIRIRILVILSSHKKLNFYMKNILRVGYRSKRFYGGRAFFICNSVELYNSLSPMQSRYC